jgi:NAD(P)-dependent dehydrogenase (short-subunit alcohol dehydrogenase family)
MAADRNLEGKVAIVTGASQGLGEAIAYLLADRGAKIVVTDIQTQAGEAVAKKISARGADAVFLGHDVAEETRWEAVVSRATELFGKVDILVNNAGLIEFAPTEDISVEMFDRLMRVNVRGVFLGCKTVLPAMKLAGGWRDRQYVLDDGHRCQRLRASCLRHHQGCCASAHQGRCPRLRKIQHSGEFSASGHDRFHVRQTDAGGPDLGEKASCTHDNGSCRRA